jgi:subtilisin
VPTPTITESLQSIGVAPVIVVLNEQLEASTTTPLEELGQYFVTSELTQASAIALAASVDDEGVTPPPPVRYYPNLGLLYGNVTESGLEALQASTALVGEVTGAPPISPIRPTAQAITEPPTPITWGIEALGVPELWGQGLSGKGVRVGHLDSGADGAHPVLAEAIAAFAQFDELGEMVTPAPEAFDTQVHGTHTAATIAGRAVAGKQVGVAPGAELVSAIVIEGGEAIARVLGGMDWAVGNGIKILNMSLGVRGWKEDFLPLTQLLRSRGVLPVFASGNEGPGSTRSPGNYPEALSVGASDANGQVPGFSSSQTFARDRDPIVPDLVAPGAGIISARRGGGYMSLDGSSMGTPHVSGLAALLWEAKPDASPDAIEAAIFGSCQLPTGVLPERANRGVPHAPTALKTLTGG